MDTRIPPAVRPATTGWGSSGPQAVRALLRQGWPRRQPGRGRIARRERSPAPDARQHRRAAQPAGRDHHPVTNAVAAEAAGARADSRRFVLLCGLAPAILTVALVVYRPGFVAGIDYAAYDVLLRSIPVQPSDGRVAIVDVDDLSLSRIGQWPWRRDRIAELISRLREQGAAVIALDVVFAEPDRSDPETSEPSSWDETLASALVGGRVVLGYALTFGGTDGGRRDCLLHPLAVPIVHPEGRGTDVPLFHAEGAVCSLPALARAAGRSGFLNAIPDADGILRRVPLVIDYGGTAYPGLALAAVLAAQGASRWRCARGTRIRRPWSSRQGRSRSTGGATCSSATAERSVRFRTSPPWRCSPAAVPATPSGMPSSSSGRRPLAAARWSRRPSIRDLPASRSRRRSPTISCAATSSRGPNTR